MASQIVLSPKQVVDLLDRLESNALFEDDRKVLKEIVMESLGMRVIRIVSTKPAIELGTVVSPAQER